MPLFSADLTLIQDSIARISNKISRDYVELENLQNSTSGYINFSTLVVNYIKKTLFDYFKDKKPNYDIVFQTDDITNLDLKSDSRYFISPLCGKINLMHALPYFTVSIALLKKDKDGNFKTLCGIIDNPITQETFITEEGKGAYVNSRRIRVSGRTKMDDSLICIKNVENKDFMCECIKKYKNIMITNCEVLNICNVAAGKCDATVLNKKSDYQDLALLMLREAGGLTKTTENGEFIACNYSLYSQF